MTESNIPAVLRERASLQPNDTAYTFVDYEWDPAGVAESWTWSQVYRRVQTIAHELRSCGSTGDRAAILAPQGLDYVAAFLGALHAGFIGVPLSVPQAGAHDERIRSVLSDTAPTVLLTTSSAVGNVAAYAEPLPGQSAPSVVEVDLLDYASPKRVGIEKAMPSTAYLQYTSGSTRTPAGVVISHKNVTANYEQKAVNYFGDCGNVLPANATVVSWLPFFHDMGLILGITTPILGGVPGVLTSPVAFLQQPTRWLQMMTRNPRAWTAAPNFAFELTMRRTTDEEMAGLDLGDVLGIISGSERIHPATIRRFTERFARCNLSPAAILPSYGLAEAVVFVATRTPGQPPHVVHFESEKLSAGHAKRCPSGGGIGLVSYGAPTTPAVRIVNPETSTECPAETVGELWVQGENVAMGYWHNPESTARTFGGRLVGASNETSQETWLRTGDLGFISEGELFIMGRIKDVLIVYGRNHYPEDIEATVQGITRGRVAAIAVSIDRSEKLVAIIELKKRGDTEQEVSDRFDQIKRDVSAALSTSHGLSPADLVLVAPGSIPITTSGKIRRALCVELYQQDGFTRIDA
jgi:long-chain fatty acid adenylyltransferase FadD28